MLDRCLLQDTLQSAPVKPELEIKSVTPSAIDQSVNPVAQGPLPSGELPVFKPACFSTLFSVPGGTSTLSFPATVTVPRFDG
jgi:hypothetical protein